MTAALRKAMESKAKRARELSLNTQDSIKDSATAVKNSRKSIKLRSI